ncbi:hypothetical protein N7488_004769 [Penicillium malachiteum]|nr:hypothetical protein N7488_004769 [Penicillium malachiteum]
MGPIPQYFVTFYFSGTDTRLSDADLLRKMLEAVKQSRVTLSSEPIMGGMTYCLSIEVKGTCQASYNHSAEMSILNMIEQLPEYGLPFDRSFVFRKG